MEDMPTGGAERRERPMAPETPRCTSDGCWRPLRPVREILEPCQVSAEHVRDGGAAKVLRALECPQCGARHQERTIIKKCVFCTLDEVIESGRRA